MMPGALGEIGANQLALLAHAAATNRVALLHAADDSTAAELETLAGTYRANPNARYGALLAPAAIVPGVTSVDTRTVSYEALAAGIMARNDRLYGVNDPAAGAHGRSSFAIDLTATFTDAERDALNTAGVNVARSIYGQVQTYGYRTLADPEDGWGLLSNARLNMQITAELEAVAESYVFSQIDGRGVRISQFGADLVGKLIPYYESGALFGATAGEAFYVDVGQAVNPVDQLAQGILRAVVGVRMSPFAELVVIEVVKVAIDQPLTALAA
jgi:phage tail sheath protein FI